MSIKKHNLVGFKIGRITVLSEADMRGASRMWNVECECGKKYVVYQGNLLKNTTEIKSCGCYTRELIVKRCLTHGESSKATVTTEYKAWASMISRCYNPKCPSYKYYGAKGITVCDEWRNSYECFLKDMGRKPTPKHSNDRIDSKKNYEKSNCKWSTDKEQQYNRGSNHLIEHLGEVKPLGMWAEIYKTDRRQFRYRLKMCDWNMDVMNFRYYNDTLQLKEPA